MADFRKSLVLAAAVLAFGVSASAQVYSCTGTTGAPPILRSEDNTALTGTIVISCANVPPGTTVNLDVTLNAGSVPITSRVGEPIILVNGVTQAPGAVITVGAGTTANTVRFVGVVLPSQTDVITITGIRGNVTPSFVTIGPGGFGLVTSLISVSNGSLPLQQNVFTTGLVELGFGGLGVVSSGVNFSTCAGTFVAQSPSANVFSSVKFSELFPTAFKVQGSQTSTSTYTVGTDSESGTNPVVPAQIATSATQFAVTFNNIPSGVTLYVPLQIYSTGGSFQGNAQLVATEGSTVPVSGSAPGVINIGSGVLVVPVTAGTTLFYNVFSVDPSAIDTFTVPVYFGVAAGGGSASASTTVTVTYAPRASTSPTLVPRFTPPSTAGSTVNLFGTASTCQTTLLFTFLTNQAGFDSGFSIAGTGTGLYGDPQQGGTCTINMYGANAPATPPVVTVPSAGEGHTTISAIAPGFQGFAVAVCNFNYAHGYAFLSDGFMGPGKGLSEGYVANVLRRLRREDNSVNESLGH